MVPKTVKTTCPYCGVGCGVLADVDADGAVSVSGDREHPANFGRLCSKGSALAETLALDDRLLDVTIHGRKAGWDEALDLVGARFNEAIAAHGPDSVAFYVSGQLLTEDYYVANKLMKGFIGSANIDTNSRLCMSSSVAGHKRAFGADTVPGHYMDLEQADLVVLVGSNLAWCHPVLYQRMLAAREKSGMRLVVIDPRRTPTAENADLHLPIDPDGDIALFNGLFRHLATHCTNRGYVERHTRGLDAALDAAGPENIDAIARDTGLAINDLKTFFDLFATTERVVTVYSQGVNQSTSGTDKVNAIINCHLVTGRIGRAGMGPFSVTGQPNAMGGREVGGLANMLAAHLDIDSKPHRDLVQTFWRSPRIAEKAGLKAVDMFRAVADGRIKALWIMATNPAVSMPEADLVQEALRRCPFVVVSDVLAETDTVRHAHVKLPAAAWGEKDGTVTNSDRTMSRQRPFLPLPGMARPDWWIISQVGGRMGFSDAFPYTAPSEIFAEHAALSAYENDGTRDFDIGAFAQIGSDAYDRLTPVQWPVRAGEDGSPSRFFARGGFFTPDRRGRFVAVKPAQAPPGEAAFPLVLNTGRVRDHWHTMTRTGKSPRLSGHITEPFVSIHPADARRIGAKAGELLEVTSPHGRIVARAQVTDTQRPGALFAPMHWNDQFASSARIDALVPARTCPISGQPASKRTAVAAAPFVARWYGFAVLRQRPGPITAEYWALARVRDGWQVELAGCEEPAVWPAYATNLLAAGRLGAQLLTYVDAARKRYRVALVEDGRLTGVLFVAPEPLDIARGFLAEALGETEPTAASLRLLLAGRPGKDRPDKGPIVCSCFQVGRNQIAAAIADGCSDVAAVGQALKAGTNCGSCRSEIGRLIEETAAATAA